MTSVERLSFPPDFVWGAATSAYQVEGAAAEDGRGPSIWDTYCHLPGVIADASSGDVACDHYHRLESDLDLLTELGVNAYRFSVSWSRVQPLGYGAWNASGLDFYDRLVDGLLKRNIAPYLTLYHWDLPQGLQDRGGWAERDTAFQFSEYAQTIGRRLGDRVKSIATHNEPWVVATLGNFYGTNAPGLKDIKIATQVSHHLLLSHGLAVRALRETGTKASLGIVLNQAPMHPASDQAEDVAQARMGDGFLIRWYMDPLFLGAYPQDVLKILGPNAPQVEAGDMDIIRTPMDFLGINYYTRSIVSRDSWSVQGPGALGFTSIGWEVYPQGLVELLLRLKREYPVPPIYITENGASYDDVVEGQQVHDTKRKEYLQWHVAAVAEAIEKGVDVRGYFVWSLMDVFEWAFGYSMRLGIIYVDYPTGQRWWKDSGRWYRQFLSSRRRDK